MDKSAQTELFDSMDNLPGKLVNAWNDLSSDEPFMSLEWFSNFVETVVGNTAKIVILAVSDSEKEYIGILPMQIKKQGLMRSTCLSSITNYYSPMFCLLAQDGSRSLVARSIADFLSGNHFKWDYAELSPIHDGKDLLELKAAFDKNSFFVSKYYVTINWRQPVSSYHEYIESRSSKLTNTIKRKRKKLENNFNVKIDLYSEPDEIDKVYPAYLEIYNASWKQEEPYPNFTPGLLRLSAENSSLRLAIAWLDEKPAAAQLWIVEGATAYIYKLAYHPDFSKYSPGTVLTDWLVKHVTDTDKVKLIDFLTGDDGYKKDWMDDKGEMHGLHVVNKKTAKGFLMYLKEISISAAKTILRK